jgi:hypothetical protein
MPSHLTNTSLSSITGGVAFFDTVRTSDVMPVPFEQLAARLERQQSRLGMGSLSLSKVLQALQDIGSASDPLRLCCGPLSPDLEIPAADVELSVWLEPFASDDLVACDAAGIAPWPINQRSALNGVPLRFDCEAAAMRTWARNSELCACLLVNLDGHLARSTDGLIVLEVEDGFITPPVSDGALDHRWREELIEKGWVQERSVSQGSLFSAEAVVEVRWSGRVLRLPTVDGVAIGETGASTNLQDLVRAVATL